MLIDWLDRYPIVSIEDPLAEHDTAGLTDFTKAVGHRVQIVGDDFLVTDAGRLRRAAAMPACNAILVKPNQVGTVTEAKAAVDAARAAQLGLHRFRPLGRDRGRHHRPPRGRLERTAAQGRLVLALRTHGEVERSAARRGSPG